MRKFWLIGLLAMALAAPGVVGADVAAGAGNVTLFGHIDFVGRYSAEDNWDQDDLQTDGITEVWPGYESYNVEFAVLGIAGQLGDNVTWVITNAFAFLGPIAPLQTALAGVDEDFQGANMVNHGLLDARIDWMLTDSVVLSAGRFIPPTSMTWNPHLMKVLHTINYPLINGSGLQVLNTHVPTIPLPMYQTGVMLTVKMGAASIMVANYNGMEITDSNPDNFGGMNNTMDIDKSKGTSVKLAAGSDAMQGGVWYNAEKIGYKRYNLGAAPPVSTDGIIDGDLTQWGVEISYNAEAFMLQGQLLSTTLDQLDSGKDDIEQTGWYVLAGFNAGPAQIVARYDYFDYFEGEDLDGDGVDELDDGSDEESAITLGVNYGINDNTTLGVNYTMRDVEDWDTTTDEIAVIIEANLF